MSTAEPKVVEKSKVKLKKPSLYNVVLVNDDYTPMELVILVLIQIFHKNVDDAHAIMLHIHNHGSGVAGTYTYEIACQKKDETIATAQANGYPLQAKLESAT